MDDMAMVPAEVQALVLALAEPKPMRRGSVTKRYVKCNKPGCSCTENPEARHGPYISGVSLSGGLRSAMWQPK